MTISSGDRLHLANLLGMLGSDQIGERDNAAKLVETFRRRHGLIWTDLLASRLMGDPLKELLGQQPNRPSAAVNVPPISRTPDAVWRWSMLAGLVAVGVMSLAALMQPQATAGMTTVAPEARVGCAAGMDGGGGLGCEPATREPLKEAATAPTGFAQGVADRQVWETWHKSASAVLCAGHVRPDQMELKSTCAAAANLATQFDQRRRNDPAYRLGWNSVSS